MRTIFCISSKLHFFLLFLSLIGTASLFGASAFEHLRSDNRIGKASPVQKSLAVQGTELSTGQTFAGDGETVSAEELKRLAISYSDAGNAEKASYYLVKYIESTGDLSIINHHLFEPIARSNQYLAISEKFKPNLNLLSSIYIFAGFLGMLIFFLLLFRRGKQKVSNLLIASFILIHSIFILHLSLYITNTQYHYPQALFISTIFSFLYGPLMYFYFRRVTMNYRFKRRDLLHLLPTVILMVYILPYLTMGRMDKFDVLMSQGNLLLPMANTIIAVKLASLLIYGFLSLVLYRDHSMENRKLNKNVLMWQRNIIAIYGAYIAAYFVYAAIVTRILPFASLVHFLILVMVGLVFYVAYISYEQPEIFKGRVTLVDPVQLFKYKKSRLTPSYSEELKQNLLFLLDEEKIYKQNNINLELLAEKLGTNRHNTSQVINEHFGMNFFELINKYRISEAVMLLENNAGNEMSIIEVAYEVGFNNKVTFNKSFKKYVAKTPTQFILSLQA